MTAKRFGSPSVLLQVAALAAAAVVASQTVAFIVLTLTPEPPPPGFSIAAAAEALHGRPAATADGRALTRRITTSPPVMDTSSAVAQTVAMAIAARAGAAPDTIRVAMASDGAEGSGALRFVLVQPPGEASGHTVTVKLPSERSRAAGADTEADADPRPAVAVDVQSHVRISRLDGAETVQRVERSLGLITDQIAFPPFTAAMALDDGRWAVVGPPRELLTPWQRRILIGLLASMLLMAPLVWLMAQRLARPIGLFAGAAERLGADPEAPPLSPSGPREVRVAIAAFNDMQGRIRRHMAERTETIAAIAHDLRTPLTRLRFRAEQTDPALGERMAADIEEMDALIAQALAYARGETAVVTPVRLNLARLARQTVRDFAETGADVSAPGGRAVHVMGDSAALRRALTNLIDNAVKFSGGARVRLEHGVGEVCVLIEDDGPGVPATDIESLFEPFVRGERSRSRATGGAGLGLAVARRIARAHGGDVTLENREGGGLTARLGLPASD